MSISFEIRGVYRKKRNMTYHGKPSGFTWMFFAQLKPFGGCYAPPWPISEKLYDRLLAAGADKLEDR